MYRTFNMDRITIFFVRHLAFADLSIVVLLGVPTLITHIADRWALGSYMCTVCAYLLSLFPQSTLYFAAIVGLHRLVRCTYPQTLHSFSRQQASLLAGVTWAASSLSAVSKLGYRLQGVFLQPWATCYFNVMRADYPLPLTIISSISVAVPSLILVTSSIYLIVISIRVQRRHAPVANSNKTAYLIAILYFTSWVPFAVSETYQKIPHSIPLWTHNLLNHFYFLRNVGNPLIYCVVNRRFYQFTVRLLRRHWCWCSQGNRRRASITNSCEASCDAREHMSGREEGIALTIFNVAFDDSTTLTKQLSEQDNGTDQSKASVEAVQDNGAEQPKASVKAVQDNGAEQPKVSVKAVQDNGAEQPKASFEVMDMLTTV